MKRLIIATCILSAVTMGCNNNEAKKTDTTATDSSTASTTTPPTDNATPTPPVDSATATRNWIAYGTPGDMHKLMAGWEGTWDCDIITWHAPGTPPDSSKGKAVNKMIMGGRYQQSIHTGNMMGMPFEGISTTGYDNAKKTFITNWIDNMGTGMMTTEGTWDEASKSLTQTGDCVDPSTGTAKKMAVRQVTKVLDDKNQVFEMYCPGPDGKEYKMMEVKMMRK